MFQSWCDERGINRSVLELSEDELNQCIACFVHEAVKTYGHTPYPLYQIVVSIQRYLRENGRPQVSFFDEHSPTYDTLHKSL